MTSQLITIENGCFRRSRRHNHRDKKSPRRDWGRPGPAREDTAPMRNGPYPGNGRTVIFEIDETEPLNRRLWQELVYLRAGLTCETCGKRPYGDATVRPMGGHATQLDAHHVNGDATDHRLANGACLCNSCHATETMTGRKRQMSATYYAAIRARPSPAPLSEETKQLISAKAKARCADADFRAGMSERTSARWQDPDFRKRAVAGMRRAWAERKMRAST